MGCHCIIPLLEEWIDTMVIYGGCCADVLFLKMAKRVRRDAAGALVLAAGGDDINLLQEAYYNGSYGFSLVKVSMCY